MTVFQLVLGAIGVAAFIKYKKKKPMPDLAMISNVDGSWTVTRCRKDNVRGVPVLATVGAGNMLLEPRYPLRLRGGRNLYIIAKRNAEDNIGVGNCEIDISVMDLDLKGRDNLTDIEVKEQMDALALKELNVASLVPTYKSLYTHVLEPTPAEVSMKVPEQAVGETGEGLYNEDGSPTIKLVNKTKVLETAVFAIEPNAAQLKRVLSQIYKDYDPNMYGKDISRIAAFSIIVVVFLIIMFPFINEIVKNFI